MTVFQVNSTGAAMAMESFVEKKRRRIGDRGQVGDSLYSCGCARSRSACFLCSVFGPNRSNGLFCGRALASLDRARESGRPFDRAGRAFVRRAARGTRAHTAHVRFGIRQIEAAYA